MSIYYIYKIINTCNDKVYIGFTSRTPEVRFMGHVSSSKSSKNKSAIHRALAKHGVENSMLETLYCSKDKDHCLSLEQHFIEENNSLDREFGYNLKTGGSHCTFSDESKKKMSDARKGKYLGVDNPTYGRKHTDETKRKLSIARRKRITKDSTRQKISESCKGRVVSEETRKKISDGNKGRVVSEETKNKLSVIATERMKSPELRKIISESNKGRVVSDSTKAAISEASKGGKNHEARKIKIKGVIYGCIKDAARELGIKYTTLHAIIRGANNSGEKYGIEDWEFVLS